MNRPSNITRITRETVSLETLEKNLPRECWSAVKTSLENGTRKDLSDELYYEFQNAEATPVLTDEEKHELFESLGNDFVKGHYSTSQLRSFLDNEPRIKKLR